MPKEERQRVKFTGKRTGLSSMAIKGVGVVSVGDTIEVSAEEAENWTALLPMADGKEGSDFTTVGGVYKLDEGESAQKRLMQREKYAVDPDDVLPAEVNTEMAHVTADTGTVEEHAELLRVEDPITDPKPDDDKPKKSKKAE